MRKKAIVIMIICLLLAGCGIFNPYKSKFDCPMGENGKCISVPDAYKESMAKTSSGQEYNNNVKDKDAGEGKKGNGAVSAEQQVNPREIYQQEMAKKLVGFIKQPITPFLAPPSVARALILPYKASSKELYSERYIYFIVDEPQWVISAPVYGSDSRDLILEKPENKAR